MFGILLSPAQPQKTMEDVFEEADALPEEFQSMSADDLKRRARLLDNEIRVCARPCSPVGPSTQSVHLYKYGYPWCHFKSRGLQRGPEVHATLASRCSRMKVHVWGWSRPVCTKR